MSAVLRTVYAICLLFGATTHAWTVIKHGVTWDYNGAPAFSRVYWTSLTVLDPVAALLLFLKPRTGLVLTVAIITTDVAHNTWLMLRSSTPDWLNWMYLLQVLFLLLVLATVRAAWRGTHGVVKQPALSRCCGAAGWGR